MIKDSFNWIKDGFNKLKPDKKDDYDGPSKNIMIVVFIIFIVLGVAIYYFSSSSEPPLDVPEQSL